ncbi:UNVERIFIED_CONTAM: hypothetical protein FKN15_029679 [Acipenser sinensis]
MSWQRRDQCSSSARTTALKMNMKLRELYLADNKLNGLQDSAQLGNLLKFNCYIQILDLRNNHIQDLDFGYYCSISGLLNQLSWSKKIYKLKEENLL